MNTNDTRPLTGVAHSTTQAPVNLSQSSPTENSMSTATARACSGGGATPRASVASYRASACPRTGDIDAGKPDAQTLENYLIEAAGLLGKQYPESFRERSQSSMVTSPMTAQSRRLSGRGSSRRSSRTPLSRPWSSPSSRTTTRSGSGLIRSFSCCRRITTSTVLQNLKAQKSAKRPSKVCSSPFQTFC